TVCAAERECRNGSVLPGPEGLSCARGPAGDSELLCRAGMPAVRNSIGALAARRGDPSADSPGGRGSGGGRDCQAAGLSPRLRGGLGYHRPWGGGVRVQEGGGVTYGSVCSGIEAATVAWKPLGWIPAFFAEIDRYCCALLRHYWPDVPNLG